ncbi:MAG TPA: glycosyltransferase [Burkholderiales bacterium]|nr:glycosyltransferase [Burkholderiales bacterium]
MRFLFVHQNFPGQYRHLVAHLARAGHEVVAIGETPNLRRTPRLAGVKLYGYETPPAVPSGFSAPVQGAVDRGRRVVAGAAKLRQAGFRPDVIGAHIGWGEALFLKDVFPEAKLLLYCEFFYRSRGADMGFDPEFPATAEKLLRLRVMNAPLLMALDAADCGMAPTRWQHRQFPAAHQPRIAVLHDGIDTDVVAPAGERDPNLITYVARNLEPYRGFHSFMRAIPEIQRRRPQARIVIVGGDEVSYSPRLPPGQTYRQRLLAELGDRIDLSRVEFRGKIPYADYLALLRRSAVHVYLTYPFVLSWSLLEAMSAGCLVVASRTAPVEEVMRDGENGLLVDFFSPAAIAERVDYALTHQDEFAPLRERARASVVERYDLRRICLPAQLRLVEALVSGVRSAFPDKRTSHPRPTPPPVKEKAGSTAA